MTQTIRLLEDQIKLLESLPEQGMGYQIVDIDLDDGQVLIERTVFNSTYLKLHHDEHIDPKRIVKIRLH